ncbi:hypothetical protein vseg_003448 [Gypsophila vaccaria]
MLDTQVAHLAASNAARTLGTLLPQGTQLHETINAFTLRSGVAYEGPRMLVEPEVNAKKIAKPSTMPAENKIEIKVPFPYRLKKNSPFKEQFRKFKEVPSYAKFLKEVYTRKRSLTYAETVAFTEERSALL